MAVIVLSVSGSYSDSISDDSSSESVSSKLLAESLFFSAFLFSSWALLASFLCVGVGLGTACFIETYPSICTVLFGFTGGFASPPMVLLELIVTLPFGLVAGY